MILGHLFLLNIWMSMLYHLQKYCCKEPREAKVSDNLANIDSFFYKSVVVVFEILKHCQLIMFVDILIPMGYFVKGLKFPHVVFHLNLTFFIFHFLNL
jgi:hypothetical protein